MADRKHAPREYVYIRAWRRMLGSFSYYIQEEQERAADEGAPVDALYRKTGQPGWVTLRDVAPITRKRIEEWAK